MKAIAVIVLGIILVGTGGTAYAAREPGLCGPPATEYHLEGNFPASQTILNSPLLTGTLVGATGSFTGHLVFTPIPAPPPAVSDGCKENSRFEVTNFTGQLVVSGPLAVQRFGTSPVPLLVALQPTDISLQVHFGTEPNKPILTFRSSEPVLFLGESVRFVHIIGLEVVASH